MVEHKMIKPRGIRPKFMREGNQDFIEISIIGDPNIYRGKVTDEHRQKFPAEWEAYKSGRPLAVKGQALTELPDINEALAKAFGERGIRTLEELAHLSDAAIQRTGIIGAINFRKAAREKLGLSSERLVG